MNNQFFSPLSNLVILSFNPLLNLYTPPNNILILFLLTFLTNSTIYSDPSTPKKATPIQQHSSSLCSPSPKVTPNKNASKNSNAISTSKNSTNNENSTNQDITVNHPFFQRSSSTLCLSSLGPDPFQITIDDSLPLACRPHLLQPICRKEDLFGRFLYDQTAAKYSHLSSQLGLSNRQRSIPDFLQPNYLNLFHQTVNESKNKKKKKKK